MWIIIIIPVSGKSGPVRCEHHYSYAAAAIKRAIERKKRAQQLRDALRRRGDLIRPRPPLTAWARRAVIQMAFMGAHLLPPWAVHSRPAKYVLPFHDPEQSWEQQSKSHAWTLAARAYQLLRLLLLISSFFWLICIVWFILIEKYYVLRRIYYVRKKKPNSCAFECVGCRLLHYLPSSLPFASSGRDVDRCRCFRARLSFSAARAKQWTGWLPGA